MTTRINPAAEGHRLATRLARQLGDDIRNARVANGLSQSAVGAAAGMSHTQISRIERAEVASLTIDHVCSAGLAVGLKLAARLYPDGDAVRDAGQLRLLERFRATLPPGTGWGTEVPLPIPGDRRAWDAVIRLDGRRAGCEAETRLADVQALERRLALKARDGDVDVLILIVADTTHNRVVLEQQREALRGLLPLDGRDVRRALREGRLPHAGGLIVV
ncbi:MAG TPA: helix-turn-helix transcriptional regulator [Candidatus Limnocylindrales bacterium]